MKNLSFFCLLSLLIFFSSCEKSEDTFGVLSVRVINESNQTLDNVSVGDFDFGKVRKRKNTKYQSLEYISLVDGYPVIRGQIGKEEYGVYMFCGNSTFSEITEGLYTIRANFDDNCLYFSLEDDDLM